MNQEITLEELGYIEVIDDNNMIVYDIQNNISDTDRLIFYKTLKNFEIYTQSDSPFESPIPQTINMQELQAIYNKCKDLGWLDE